MHEADAVSALVAAIYVFALSLIFVRCRPDRMAVQALARRRHVGQ
jgi:hypothetical protein